MKRGRILCVTSNFPRWAGDSTTPFVLNLAVDLQELGWQVTVLVPHAQGTALREILEGVKVERFRYLWPSKLETVCYQGGALINLRKHRADYVKLPALVASEFCSIVRRLIGKEYDLLHSHWILPQGFTGTLASRLFGVPHVTTVHGGDVFGLQGAVLTRFKRFTLRHADAVTINSSVTERAVFDIVPDLKELHQIPMGVSTSQVNAALSSAELQSRYRRGNGPLLVFAGRIVEEKGVEDLIRAVGILVPRFPDISALIVGEGQDRPAFEHLAGKLGLSDHVVFTGWVEPKDVFAYLAAGDIFIGPSRKASNGWIEAQGLALIEAMVAKTPVIATRSGGIIDAVRHEETGILVNERAPDEIAQAVERLVKKPRLVNYLREQAYKLALNEFSRASSAQAFSDLFSRMIQAKRLQCPDNRVGM
ncbi:MAG: glycosyltransferase family 4 protein [Deltaproteobacteria bacterium]|nr:MAG: glycosyltransferase family 4 protein [Deltaproteobacteria bacterium]